MESTAITSTSRNWSKPRAVLDLYEVRRASPRTISSGSERQCMRANPSSGVTVHLFQTIPDPALFSTARQRSVATEVLSAERTDTKLRGNPGYKSLFSNNWFRFVGLNGPGVLDPDAIVMNC